MEYNIIIKFEWDENKNRLNFKKHLIWFEEAKKIWTDFKANAR